MTTTFTMQAYDSPVGIALLVAGRTCYSFSEEKQKNAAHTSSYIIHSILHKGKDSPACSPALTGLLVAERKRTCAFGQRLESEWKCICY